MTYSCGPSHLSISTYLYTFTIVAQYDKQKNDCDSCFRRGVWQYLEDCFSKNGANILINWCSSVHDYIACYICQTDRF